jgi:formylglycine-generating enzyme required for sulfatase activity
MLIPIPAGRFSMGTDHRDEATDGEWPPRQVEMGAFRISATTVTNTEFASFVEATGYATSAEGYGWSFVFAGLLAEGGPATRAAVDAPWWRQVGGASWRQPEGPGSSIVGRDRHPVVHVSWIDAMAYCEWADVRLPTEAEWEYSARGGLEGRRFPWGDDLVVDGTRPCNIFDGPFPVADGPIGTVPVDAYPPNGYGLHNCVGNVWEWCLDAFDHQTRVIRGGSYLCHDSYCSRYRVAARSGNSPDASTGNLGFRIASGPAPDWS